MFSRGPERTVNNPSSNLSLSIHLPRSLINRLKSQCHNNDVTTETVVCFLSRCKRLGQAMPVVRSQKLQYLVQLELVIMFCVSQKFVADWEGEKARARAGEREEAGLPFGEQIFNLARVYRRRGLCV